MTMLPVVRACDLERGPTRRRMLIESLWGLGAVGIIGGEPKSYKSFLALSMGVSVASGQPCLGHYAVARGAVLLYAAEDAAHIVRERLDVIANAIGVTLSSLDLWVITAPTVRLDLPADTKRLDATISELSPALVILDPFVRMHRVDENLSAAVVPLLAYLRDLQRRHGCAVCVVHHARKGAAHVRGGQALRGTSEFHAWADTILSVRRATTARVRLAIEHRAEPSPPAIDLAFSPPGILSVIDTRSESQSAQPTGPPMSPQQRLLAALTTTGPPIRAKKLRELCRIRTATMTSLLDNLVANGQVVRTREGWSLAPTLPFPDV